MRKALTESRAGTHRIYQRPAGHPGDLRPSVSARHLRLRSDRAPLDRSI